MFAHGAEASITHPLTAASILENVRDMFLCSLFATVGTFAPFLRSVGGALGYHGEIHVIGKAYFVRQAEILFRFAKATKDPKVSAALMEKAADLKLQVDDPSASRDLTPPAPDIEPPSAT